MKVTITQSELKEAVREYLVKRNITPVDGSAVVLWYNSTNIEGRKFSAEAEIKVKKQ